MIYKIKEREAFIARFSDPNFDPGFTEYKNNLYKLNEIALSTGEFIEGNIFYPAHLTQFQEPHAEFLGKRRTLSLASNVFNNVLEIGFNAGHSALLLLTLNPNLKLTCVDICVHKYTPLCFQYLHSVFGDRVRLVEGNSLQAFPSIQNLDNNFDYDFFIIDGGHGVDVAEIDLFNVINFGRAGSIILFDDTTYPELRTLIDMYLITGQIISIADPMWIIKNTNQMLFINNKRS